MASKASKPSKSTKGAKKAASKSPQRQPAKPKAKGGGRGGASGSASGGGADLAATLFRPEVMGAALVLLAVFTLLALVTGSRGGVTEGWVGVLRSLFGGGVWGIPLVAGALGLWLIIRAIERMPNMSWQRPVGFGILFLAVITAAALRLAPDARLQAAYAGEGGGELGSAFADGLQALLGTWGAWAAVTFLFILGIVFLADRILIDAWYWLSDWSNQRAQTPMQGPAASPTVPPPPPLKPPVPLPTGVVPWWKRLLAPKPQQTAPLPPAGSTVLPPAGANLVRPEATRLPDDFLAKLQRP